MKSGWWGWQNCPAASFHRADRDNGRRFFFLEWGPADRGP